MPKKNGSNHKFNDKGPCSESFRQPGAVVATNANPLASQDGRKFPIPDPCETDAHCQFKKKITTGKKG